MFLGVASLVVYIADGRESAIRQAYLARGMSTLVLAGLGIMMAITVAVIRARHGLDSTLRSRMVNRLAALCSVGARIVFACLILAVLAYAVFLGLVLSDND
jgi:hypothetical protein